MLKNTSSPAASAAADFPPFDFTTHCRTAPRRAAGVHRSWLDPVRPVLARVSRPRKALGRIHGLAVRFGEPTKTSTLLVGEGIETVLSLVTVLPHGALRAADPSGTFAAAALSAGSLGAFVPPSHIARLIVAQDRDKAGGRAARRLQLRCARLGIASTVLVPHGGDFNDDLVKRGPRRLASKLTPLVIRPHGVSRCGFAADEEQKNGWPE